MALHPHAGPSTFLSSFPKGRYLTGCDIASRAHDPGISRQLQFRGKGIDEVK